MISPYFVPVRPDKAGALTLRTGRLQSGERVGLAFTSETALLLTMGPTQPWVRLDRLALADMLAPLGVGDIRVDPQPVLLSEIAPRASRLPVAASLSA